MKDFINNIYRNHSLIYKVILFILTTFLIVYFFPKSGKFRYSFEKGKPWQSENLYAPFDFAIKKTENELEVERKAIRDNATPYFNLDKEIVKTVKDNYQKQFQVIFSDTIARGKRDVYYAKGNEIIGSIYANGVLDNPQNFNENQRIILLENQQEVRSLDYSQLIIQQDVRNVLEKAISDNGLSDFQSEFLSVFFDVIKPNVEFNKVISDNVLQEELDNISLFEGRIDREELIISKGKAVDDTKFRILSSLEQEYQSQVWTQSNYNWIIVAYTLLVSLALLMLLLFLRKYRLDIYNNNTKVTFIFFNMLVVILLTTLIVNYNSEYLYLVPICVLPLILKAFFDARLGLFAHVITVLLLGFIVPNNFEYVFLQIIAGIVTILTISELYKRANLFISVGQITIIYIIAYFAFYVIHEGSIDNLQWETFGMFILCGLATLFVLPLIYVYEKLFGLISDVSLLELSDTNSKLLKELSNKAPGTFHHSLNVANLAEAASNEIGANAMLARVGALYHDIGKMKNPTYFTENQSTGLNPHDELSPKESASVIIGHTLNGIELAKKNNLPDRIIDFIRTHHGTNLVYYFYSKEKENNEDVEESDFRYPGPKPFSKETAILMMCDSVEAASKSLKEPTSTKIDKFVETIINKQIEGDQFLNADITFKEIQSIKKVLKHKLANIYHLRIEYPE